MFTTTLKLLNIKFSQVLEFKRTVCTELDSNYKILGKILGINNKKAKKYIQQHRLSRIEPDVFTKTLTFCKEVGFNNDDILKNPILLRAYPSTLDQYYSVMIEGGFRNVNPETLAKFRTLCRKRVDVLKEANLIDPEIDVTSKFVSYLNPCPDNFHVETEGDSDNWSNIHLQVLYQYLKWRLKITDADVDRLVTVHRGICRKSFRYLCENITFAEYLGFTPEKMLKYGYILHTYPKYSKAILEQYPTIAGASMKKAMRMYPKLVTVSPENIDKIWSILKEHNIPDEAIQKRMNVFQLSPETVKFRLEELKRVADLKVLLHNPNILKLVVHHNRAKSRLSFLKELELKCTGVSILGNDNHRFDIRVREGRDANTASDINSFLKGIFNKDTNQLEHKLKKHPYYSQVPLLSMEAAYNYLKSKKFTSNAIFNVMYLLLYPTEKIEKGIEQVNAFAKQSGRALNQINRLNLVLYFIEKEHHFTGDGVWMKDDQIEEGNL